VCVYAKPNTITYSRARPFFRGCAVQSPFVQYYAMFFLAYELSTPFVNFHCTPPTLAVALQQSRTELCAVCAA
jgi:hypothetical protein